MKAKIVRGSKVQDSEGRAGTAIHFLISKNPSTLQPIVKVRVAGDDGIHRSYDLDSLKLTGE